MDSESAFRANGASLGDSVKKSYPEDQPEVDLIQQLSSELRSVIDGAVSEAEDAEANADTEPLTICLKAIRSVHLLTHQQEIDIAKRREADMQIVVSILATPVALQHVLSLAGKIYSDEIRLSVVSRGGTREGDTADLGVEFHFDEETRFEICKLDSTTLEKNRKRCSASASEKAPQQARLLLDGKYCEESKQSSGCFAILVNTAVNGGYRRIIARLAAADRACERMLADLSVAAR